VKWTSLAAFGLLASSAMAADHGDPPSSGNEGIEASDISDLYAWMSDDNTLTMIQTIPAAELSNEVYYVFNIGRSADAATAATVAPTNSDTTKVICWYDTGDQTTCVVDDGSGIDPVASVQGLAADELVNTESSLRVHVGQHADPFFFYLTGFINARQEVLEYAGSLAQQDQANYPGCPDTTIVHPEEGTMEYPNNVTVDQVLRDILQGDYDDEGMDTMPANDLEAANVTGIVVEVSTSLLAGTGDHLQVWASTHVRN
jgi:hypothetical protein